MTSRLKSSLRTKHALGGRYPAPTRREPRRRRAGRMLPKPDSSPTSPAAPRRAATQHALVGVRRGGKCAASSPLTWQQPAGRPPPGPPGAAASPRPRSRYPLPGGGLCRDSIAPQRQPPRPSGPSPLLGGARGTPGADPKPAGTCFLRAGPTCRNHRGDARRSGEPPEGGRGGERAHRAGAQPRRARPRRVLLATPSPPPSRTRSNPPEPAGRAEAGCFLLRVNAVSREERIVVLVTGYSPRHRKGCVSLRAECPRFGKLTSVLLLSFANSPKIL